MYRHTSSHKLYRFLFRSFLSHLDAEQAHHLGAVVIRMCGLPLVRDILHRFTTPKDIPVRHVAGLTFTTPFGMAAGFDKNAQLINGLYALGFGHVEVGTITAQPQTGNPRPRLFRLITDRALVNRMGFNNQGADRVARRLKRMAQRKNRPIIGVNIGKTKVVELEHAIADYCYSATKLAAYADYLVVNVSSPNTPGLRSLQEVGSLTPLLEAVKEIADGQLKGAVPVFVKIAPDLTDTEVIDICKLVAKLGLAGIIATNTTISRSGLGAHEDVLHKIGEGGLSGEPLRARSREVLALVRKHTASSIALISVGGVTTSQDVAERLELGAQLVQGYTAFLYQGPLWARGINRSFLNE